jgi:hypothetical protein
MKEPLVDKSLVLLVNHEPDQTSAGKDLS